MRNAVRLQKEALLFTDDRGKLEGELLNGIEVVKCNSWEVQLFASPHLDVSYMLLTSPSK